MANSYKVVIVTSNDYNFKMFYCKHYAKDLKENIAYGECGSNDTAKYCKGVNQSKLEASTGSGRAQN